MSTRFPGLALALAFILGLAAAPGAARADLWQGASTPAKGQLTLGAFGQLYFSPNEFMAFFQGNYGFTPRFQGELRLGMGTLDVYFGAFGKYRLVAGDELAVALWGGFHVQGSVFAIDAALPISHSFKGGEIYVAPLLQVAFAGGGSNAGVGFVPGFGVYVSKGVKLFVEFTLNASDLYNAGSVGARFYL